MSTLLDQFKTAVDMMHSNGAVGGVPLAATSQIPQLAPLATQSLQGGGLPPQAAYYPAVASTYHPLPSAHASGKQGNFLSKNWPVILGIGILIIAGIVIASIVMKGKKGGSGKKSKRKGAEDDDDDDEELVPRVHGAIPTQGQPLPRPPQIPVLQPVAQSIPTAQDMRYTDNNQIRGAPLPPNTRGAEPMLQPGAGGGGLVYPGMLPGGGMTQPTTQQPPPSILAMPPPTTTAGGLPLQPQVPNQGVPQVAAQPMATGDPNFTKL